MLVFSEIDIVRRQLPEGVKFVPLDDANKAEIEAVVCCRATATQVAGMDMPRLRLVQLTSTGVDGVPIAEFSRKGIPVANAGGVYSVAIAETVVFGMLQMAKKYRRNPNNRRVRYTRGYSRIGELAGKTVLILGTGSIGTEVAMRLAGFQMKILGYDAVADRKEGYERIIDDRNHLKTALKSCNYVVCTLPETEDTKGLVDGEFLGCMKPSGILVNVGRRSVLNEADLYRALKARTIGGAVLDMFEWLPNPITNKFRRLSSVIILPGVAAISKESDERLQNLIAQNLSRIAAHEAPGSVVNR